jgi:hypothetical protein
MTVIRQEDFVASVAAALQFISYYPPVDFIRGMARAYEREESPAGRWPVHQLRRITLNHAQPSLSDLLPQKTILQKITRLGCTLPIERNS